MNVNPGIVCQKGMLNLWFLSDFVAETNISNIYYSAYDLYFIVIF